MLKACDAHSNEYVERLKDEPRVVSILEKAEKLVQKTGSPSEAGLEKTRFFIKKNPAQWGFFGLFGFFIYICPEERIFRVFSVSRILLGASRH